MKTASNPLTAASNLIDTNNRKHLEALFLELQPNSPAVWGKMKPQQMVEHLIDQVQYTNGKKEPFCEVSEDQALLAKQVNIYTSVEIPRNVIFGEIPDQLIYPDLPTAIRKLMMELEDFDQHFMKPGTLVIHGGFGPMNHKEWCIWHNKHFSHHLKQFNIKVSPLLR
jgi:oxepin-CoA hydrolase/3-oxo-5,6-dehydrosuberyl-CoA semialdehyde dehydrogenase